MMTAEAMLDYVYKRVKECEEDMETWGFAAEDMDEWTQGNYAAYTHLLAKFLEKE